ncbi:MAG TPA: sigma 54-interacting transcriptional regulator [Planctomycetota bacterium]|nr:sigma 54-interacting transcriptional regulator [Planctomycetota bacterium]
MGAEEKQDDRREARGEGRPEGHAASPLHHRPRREGVVRVEGADLLKLVRDAEGHVHLPGAQAAPGAPATRPIARGPADERFFRVILDSIADGVFTVDRNWNITSFNRAAEVITGIPREKAVGWKCHDVFHANICQTACALRHTMETGEPVVDQPVNIVDGKARVVPVRISTAVLRDEEGDIVGGVETFRDVSAIEELRKEVARQYTFEDIVSKNHRIQEIFNILPDIAESDSTVLVEGPSGSGKELFARAIHNLSARGDKPLVVVNCGALPDTLLESELFGYMAGAFTDAKRDKPGRIALAEGGTLFLDEVGDMSPALQVRLLRVLQQREYEPLGATVPAKADVRVIAATNRRLADLVRSGVFREDLFYRLNVLKIELPRLAERREDIPLLVDHFLERLSLRQGRPAPRVSDDVLGLLLRHDFPGNVRELENILEHAFVLCREGDIRRACLPPEFLREVEHIESTLAPPGSIEENEARLIREALARHSGHRSKAAADLHIHPSTLWRKMKRYGIRYP